VKFSDVLTKAGTERNRNLAVSVFGLLALGSLFILGASKPTRVKADLALSKFAGHVPVFDRDFI
jgi:hypothetical protein